MLIPSPPSTLIRVTQVSHLILAERAAAACRKWIRKAERLVSHVRLHRENDSLDQAKGCDSRLRWQYRGTQPFACNRLDWPARATKETNAST
jgi:hypothetical protein